MIKTIMTQILFFCFSLAICMTLIEFFINDGTLDFETFVGFFIASLQTIVWLLIVILSLKIIGCVIYNCFHRSKRDSDKENKEPRLIPEKSIIHEETITLDEIFNNDATKQEVDYGEEDLK